MANAPDIDDEWSMFLTSMNHVTNLSINSISTQLNHDDDGIPSAAAERGTDSAAAAAEERPPKCTELIISTKTKVLFLNKAIDIENIFWKIPIMDYWRQEMGVVKKIVKMVCTTPEQQTALDEKLKTVPCFKQDIIRQINIKTATRTKFKDERKISVGICKKDIMSCRSKKKNVFYNCFSLMLRILFEGEFREIHIKLFNTGKMEIPGVLNDQILDVSRNLILQLFTPILGEDLQYVEGYESCVTNGKIAAEVIAKTDLSVKKRMQNVLINSNFNCGFFINREKLHNILRGEKYNLDTSYEPCSYPGLKCKFYYNNQIGLNPALQKGLISAEDRHMKMKNIISEKKYTEVSIMIFRTGSGLIMGNCSEEVLEFIFGFITEILYEEYYNIYIPKNSNGAFPVNIKNKNSKLRKKTIVLNNSGGNGGGAEDVAPAPAETRTLVSATTAVKIKKRPSKKRVATAAAIDTSL